MDEKNAAHTGTYGHAAIHLCACIHPSEARLETCDALVCMYNFSSVCLCKYTYTHTHTHTHSLPLSQIVVANDELKQSLPMMLAKFDQQLGDKGTCPWSYDHMAQLQRQRC